MLIMSPDRRHWRVVQEEEHAANWGALKSWLDKKPDLVGVRSEALGNKAAILIGNGLKELSRRGLFSFRPALVRIDELTQAGKEAEVARVQRRMASTEYRIADEELEAKVAVLVEGEIKTDKNDIIRGDKTTTRYQAEVIVGERMAEIAKGNGEPSA